MGATAARLAPIRSQSARVSEVGMSAPSSQEAAARIVTTADLVLTAAPLSPEQLRELPILPRIMNPDVLLRVADVGINVVAHDDAGLAKYASAATARAGNHMLIVDVGLERNTA